MNDLIEKILRVAASSKKKTKKKYTGEVQNLYDDLLTHLVERSDYDKHDRVFRLMMRIKKALESEGFAFREKVMPVSEAPPKSTPPVGNKHLICSGGLCTLLKSRPPAGMEASTLVKLLALVGSKQCYSFTLKPRVPEAARKNGTNVSLPKPLTWAKLENYGLSRELLSSGDGRPIMEEFRIDGVSAWTLDRVTFYCSNAGMCRRWVEGLERIANQAITK